MEGQEGGKGLGSAIQWGGLKERGLAEEVVFLIEVNGEDATNVKSTCNF